MTAMHTGSVAVVTGGARGIGLGCARSLAAKGFNLALVDVLEDELQEATGKLRATGVQAESFVADVSDFARAVIRRRLSHEPAGAICTDKVTISAAITGAVHTPSMSPILPVTPKQLGDEAVAACEAGAAIVHIHVRDPETGRPSYNIGLFEETFSPIKQ